MRLGQTSAIYFISKVAGSAIGFLATIYFARVLGEEILGFYAVALAVVTWLTLVGKVGFTRAMTKRISEGEEQDVYATAGLIILVGLGIIVSGLVWVFRDQLNAYVGEPVAVFIILIVIAVLFKSWTNASLKGYHLVHIYAPLSTTKIGLRSIIQVGLVFAGFQLTGLLVGYAAGALIVAVVGLAILRVRPVLPSKRHFRSLSDYAKYSWLGSMRTRTFDEVDILVLGIFVQAGLIGIYSVAWSIAKFLDIFGQSVKSTLFPEMSKVAAENSPEAVAGLTEDALRYTGLIVIPGFIGGTLLGDEIMAIYGEGFIQGQEVLPILIAALLIYSYAKQLINGLNAIDRPDLAFRANGAFIVGNVIFNLLLVWQMGWVGAAIATTLSAGIGLILAYYYLHPIVQFEIPIGGIFRQWVAALLMGIVVYTGDRIENHYEFFQSEAIPLVSLIFIGAVVYFLCLFVISKQFRTTVAENLSVSA